MRHVVAPTTGIDKGAAEDKPWGKRSVMGLRFRSSWFLCGIGLPLSLALGSGCGGDDPPMMAPMQMTVPSVCATETRGDTYAPGLQKPGAQQELSVTLLSSQPGPPTIGVNNWDIQVRDAASMRGGVRNDLSITALPWMPDHN